MTPPAATRSPADAGPPGRSVTGAAIEIERVWFRYGGERAAPRDCRDDESPASPWALEDVSLSVQAGERLGILGPNGGGKSTLLRLVLGLLDGASGQIRVMGRTPGEARALGLIGYVAQRPDAALAMPLSVRQLLTLTLTWNRPPWRGASAAERAWIEQSLDLVGASAFAHSHIGSLSGGQFQRVLIARALVRRPPILVLDEPTVGIDPAGQRQFADLIDRVHRELRATIIVVSHDLRAIMASSDRVACLARRLHSHTAPEGLTPQVIAEVFSHDVLGGGTLRGAPRSGGACGTRTTALHVHAHAGHECPECSSGHGAVARAAGPGTANPDRAGGEA